jgi:hypothetical protein
MRTEAPEDISSCTPLRVQCLDGTLPVDAQELAACSSVFGCMLAPTKWREGHTRTVSLDFHKAVVERVAALVSLSAPERVFVPLSELWELATFAWTHDVHPVIHSLERTIPMLLAQDIMNG